jgi:hypothetical protein
VAIDPRFPALLDRLTLKHDDHSRCEMREDDDICEVMDEFFRPDNTRCTMRTTEHSEVTEACTKLIAADCDLV